jgi:hypothetical protein
MNSAESKAFTEELAKIAGLWGGGKKMFGEMAEGLGAIFGKAQKAAPEAAPTMANVFGEGAEKGMGELAEKLQKQKTQQLSKEKGFRSVRDIAAAGKKPGKLEQAVSAVPGGEKVKETVQAAGAAMPGFLKDHKKEIGIGAAGVGTGLLGAKAMGGGQPQAGYYR